MTRYGVLFLALIAGSPEASAQSRSWVPWFEVGATPAPAPRRAATAVQAVSASATATPRAVNVVAARPASSGQVAAPKSQVKYPAYLDGGSRPSIGASSPGQVAFTGYSAGSIVVDTSGRSLYYVTSSTSAYRYPISVGREGFTWRGVERVSRIQSWPDWRPPAEMRRRDPNLPEVMSGGVNNPLGAKAIYLGSTLYRIHGTNNSRSIGYAASSGCFRMMNSHVVHLSGLVSVGATVHVLNSLPRNVAGGATRG